MDLSPTDTKTSAPSRSPQLQKPLNRRLIAVDVVLAVLLVVVLLFGQYRRYDEAVVYAKPDLEITQEKVADESVAEVQVQESTADSSYDGHFTLYSIGDQYQAASGSSRVACDVQNQSNSTHDIVMRWYISAQELKAHGLSTSGMEGDRWVVAETGRFEPGYGISSVQLRALPDGSHLPAGNYNLTLSEAYYDHDTGVLSSYETNIPITLEVKG